MLAVGELRGGSRVVHLSGGHNMVVMVIIWSVCISCSRVVWW